MKKDQIFMVFDVESVGLHGKEFAVGWTIINRFGVEIQYGLLACRYDKTFGTPEDLKWCDVNIPQIPVTHSSRREMREAFWRQYLCWKEKGALLVADCNWPVEARFLLHCIKDDKSVRNWQGPYPLHDLASVCLAMDCDPLATNPRRANELPVHNPLADARQSARYLIETLNLSK